ncbi:MAG: enoyl-CoA hydratase/isomerase family protein [Alphaproteobacteria bacterium]|nr:enoyl-CoA hydratase/isomerase family protein [Alphaproteobacteria bacterium]
MPEPVTRTQKGRIAVLTIDNPPVNGLGAEVRKGLDREVRAALADANTSAIVIAGSGKMLSAGADIREFGKPQQEPILPKVLTVIEDAGKPVVAAIHGHALGGGLELTLACHYRVAAAGTRVALPEVTLGIVPGAGGTQRLPRLAGVKTALGLMTTGEMVPVKRAQALGIVDEVVDGDVVAAAVKFADGLLATGAKPRRTRDRDDKLAEARATPNLVAEFRQGLKRSARGQESPFAVVDCVEAALAKPFDEAMAFERATFQRLVGSDQAAALRHAFFAEREATKIKDVPEDTPAAPIKRGAVLGLGTMGAGIAVCFANAGIPVRVLESSQDLLDKGLARIRGTYAGMVERKRLDQAEMDRRMGLIAGTTQMADLRDCDAVVEAVFEDMALKKEIFAKLDAACPGAAILATNTSSLDVDEIASATKRPERVIGMHFFSPANVMRLVETVRGKATSRATIAATMALNKKLGKVAALVGVCDSFVGNRMYYAYQRQANFSLEEGALPQQVDKAMQDFGFPMGPFATGDLAGVDVGWRIRKQRAASRAAQGLPPDPRRYSPLADRIAEMGRHGQKTSAGWYRYEKGGRAPIPDPEIEKLILAVSAEKGIARRSFTDQEIVERCMFPLVNEGAKILEEGIAQRASDIDVVWLFGYGFPRWRGGPMFWADRIGLDKVHAAMAKLCENDRDWCEPAPLLAKLAREGKKFAEV